MPWMFHFNFLIFHSVSSVGFSSSATEFSPFTPHIFTHWRATSLSYFFSLFVVHFISKIHWRCKRLGFSSFKVYNVFSWMSPICIESLTYNLWNFFLSTYGTVEFYFPIFTFFSSFRVVCVFPFWLPCVFFSLVIFILPAKNRNHLSACSTFSFLLLIHLLKFIAPLFLVLLFFSLSALSFVSSFPSIVRSFPAFRSRSVFSPTLFSFSSDLFFVFVYVCLSVSRSFMRNKLQETDST